MSSSIDSGSNKVPDDKCRKSEDGRHVWKLMGERPIWKRCSKCGETYYSK